MGNPTFYCQTCALSITGNRSNHEKRGPHQGMLKTPEEYTKCFKCGANLKRFKNGDQTTRVHMKKNCRVSDTAFYTGRFKSSPHLRRALARKPTKEDYKAAFEKLKSWRVCPPGGERKEEDPYIQLTSEEVSALPRKELEERYLKLQDHYKQAESGKGRNVRRRLSKEATYSVYVMVYPDEPLRDFYVGSDGQGGDRAKQHAKSKKMIGRKCHRIVENLASEEAVTVEHAGIMLQQRDKTSANEILSSQHLPYHKTHGGTQWSKVDVDSYSEVVATMFAFKLRQAYPDLEDDEEEEDHDGSREEEDIDPDKSHEEEGSDGDEEPPAKNRMRHNSD